jgi:hypothetical protein
MAGNVIDDGKATFRSPRPLIVTTPFARETDVDDGAGGSVELVDGVGAPVELEPAHAAAIPTEAVTNTTRRHRRLLRSP